jgi:predicted nucleotidyltransferase
MAAELDPAVLTAAKAYLDALRESKIDFESAWLFGSFVNGRFTADSDIDIALVMKDVANKFIKEVELTKYRRQIDWRIEPHIITADNINTPFSREIMEHGIKIA